MSLALYGHPFSSYTQKVLIGLYENGTPFEFRYIGPDTPQHTAEWLLPADPMAALNVRFLDRFFDLHVMNVVQHAVNGALTGNPARREEGLAFAVAKLELAYAWLEGELAGKAWAVGADFTLADWAFCLAFFVVLIRLSIDEDRAARGKGRPRQTSFDPNSTQIDNG
jgi:glutathione S-transferase